MPVIPINSLEEFKQIINSGKPVVIDFWAEWCGPCKLISPVFEKLSNEVQGVEFYKVDVDAQEDISQDVGIKAMPTFMYFKDGQKIQDMIGAVPVQLEALVQFANPA